jgi:hypothetical protein
LTGTRKPPVQSPLVTLSVAAPLGPTASLALDEHAAAVGVLEDELGRGVGDGAVDAFEGERLVEDEVGRELGVRDAHQAADVVHVVVDDQWAR